MRFDIKEAYLDDVGKCYQLIDADDEFGEWYSLSEKDLKHLVDFLNKQESEKLDNKRALNTLKYRIRRLVNEQ